MTIESPANQPQGFLLVGEGVSLMTQERLQMLREMVGGLGLRVTVVGDLEALGLQAEEGPEPVLASFDHLIDFGDQNGYSRTRTHKAWRAVTEVSNRHERAPSGIDPYPSIRYVESREQTGGHEGLIDLRSVHARLVASNMHEHAWPLKPRDTGTINYLAHLVNEMVRPEDPLPVQPKRFA